MGRPAGLAVGCPSDNVASATNLDWLRALPYWLLLKCKAYNVKVHAVSIMPGLASREAGS